MTAVAANACANAARTLVVDDSAVARRIVSKALGALASVEVAGTAGDIRTAQTKIRQGHVDVAIGDGARRGESGLDLLRWLKKEHPDITCILMTAGNAEGVRTEVDALMLGAAGFILKPSGEAAYDQLVEALGNVLHGVRSKPQGRIVAPRRTATVPAAYREVIAMGASTGGPPVLATVLERLPATFSTPILIVQHIPKLHAPYLADLLAERSRRRVVLGRTGTKVEANTVYIAGDGKHMTVQRQGAGLVIEQNSGPPEHHCRPAVDPLFRSVAAACGAACVGVVISGMGTDGALGAVALSSRGAPVVVQDQRTSVIWSMPGAAVAAGAVTTVAPPEGIADCIDKWTAGSARRATTTKPPLGA